MAAVYGASADDEVLAGSGVSASVFILPGLDAYPVISAIEGGIPDYHVGAGVYVKSVPVLGVGRVPDSDVPDDDTVAVESVDREVELDYIETELKKDDIVLLCTDGLTNEVDEDDIYSICMNNDISKIPQKLVRQANKLGGRDNITVSITKI